MILKIRQPADKAKVIEYIGKLPESKLYDVTVNIHRKTRSCPQNRLYHLWLNCISKETGNEHSDLHEYFVEKYLWTVKVQLFKGSSMLRWVSTTALNTAEFKAYLDKIQIFASSELGIVLPDPKDLYWDQFFDFYSNQF